MTPGRLHHNSTVVLLFCSTTAAGPGRTRLDEVLCILEVLASMSLAPAVADAALPPSEFITQV